MTRRKQEWSVGGLSAHFEWHDHPHQLRRQARKKAGNMGKIALQRTSHFSPEKLFLLVLIANRKFKLRKCNNLACFTWNKKKKINVFRLHWDLLTFSPASQNCFVSQGALEHFDQIDLPVNISAPHLRTRVQVLTCNSCFLRVAGDRCFTSFASTQRIHVAAFQASNTVIVTGALIRWTVLPRSKSGKRRTSPWTPCLKEKVNKITKVRGARMQNYFLLSPTRENFKENKCHKFSTLPSKILSAF